MVKISIILPVYNCCNFFQATMESLAAQTFRDFEIVLVNDASYDGTEGICEVYSKLPNVKYINHPQNKGLGESLNDALVASSGQYLAIQHGDDLSLPERLQKEVEHLDAHPNVYLVGTWAQNIDIDGKVMKDGWWLRQVKRIPDDPKIIKEKLLEMNCLIHTSVMFRREILGTVGFYDVNMPPAEDYDFWLRVAEQHDIGIIPQVLVQYRHHPKQISNTDGGNLMKDKARLAVERAKKRRGII